MTIATHHLNLTLGYSVIICHPAIEHTVTLMTDGLYLLLAVETTSVLLGVDTEATSHPTITISTPN